MKEGSTPLSEAEINKLLSNKGLLDEYLHLIHAFGDIAVWLANEEERCSPDSASYKFFDHVLTFHGWFIKHIPEKYRDYKLYLKAVKTGHWSLKQVPSKHLTYEMCEAAVKANDLELQYVPEPFLSRLMGERHK